MVLRLAKSGSTAPFAQRRKSPKGHFVVFVVGLGIREAKPVYEGPAMHMIDVFPPAFVIAEPLGPL